MDYPEEFYLSLYMYTSDTKHFACVQAEGEVEEIFRQMLAVITIDFAQLATNLSVAQSLKRPTGTSKRSWV